jgi:glycosyltransferase involved in cell wall biosynthesis
MKKLTVVAQVYNELKTGNLTRFLNNVREFADWIIVYDDGSTDGTWEALLGAQKHGCPLSVIRSGENDFKNEIAHKQQMLEMAIAIESDWIMWLDADEVVEPRGADGALRKLMEDDSIDGYAFHQINLWRSDKFYRLDNQYNDGIFVRLWRNNGRLRYDPKPGLHQRPYPLGVDKVKDSDVQIIHYGFADDASIIRKYLTYKEHGQTGWALNRLVNEDTLRIKRVKPEWFRSPPQGPDLEVFQTMVASKV